MIYWDNAATTWPKPMAVTEAMSRALTRYGANPGRGGHAGAIAGQRIMECCREKAAEYLYCLSMSWIMHYCLMKKKKKL